MMDMKAKAVWDAEYKLIKSLVEAYRSGTLPPELMAGSEPGDWRLKLVEGNDATT